MAVAHQTIAPRPPPLAHSSWRLWLRQNLFANRTSSLTTITLLLLGLWLLPQLWSLLGCGERKIPAHHFWTLPL
ncbi:MAG: hypothetical protein EBT70_00635 [Betaproteobacteria bacterium]|nr:hypothetical protein [Betaproteobacteria bacterium]